MLTAISNFSGGTSLEYSEAMEKKSNVTLKDYTQTFFRDGKSLTKEQRDDLILKYTPLIKYVAGRLAMRLPSHISIDDLMSPGVIGLIDAVEKFDPSKKIQFKTYAEFRIRGAMLDELRSQDWIPRSIRKKATELERTYQRIEKRLGRPAEDEEIAKAMGLNMDSFYHLLDQTRNITFLDIEMIRRRMPDSSDDDLFDLIADNGDTDPFEQLNMTEVREILIKAITELPEKEKLVVSLYYYEDLTMREIGEIMGYTESRISQMHTKAMLRLRARLEDLAAGSDGNPY
jgi:RNA polymerase sigma factor for flagellar operon FliA